MHGRNHELERAYQAERNAARAKRREAERTRRAQIAEAFLVDKSQRALVHPAPSPKRCTLATDQGRVFFDVATDEGVARDVPAEAHRRFRADLAAKKEKNLRERAAQLALHEEKKRFIADWIEKNGTPDQRERQAAGMLPMLEAIEALTDAAFAPLADWPVYTQNSVQRLQRTVEDRPGHRAEQEARSFMPADLVAVSSNAASATPTQWALVRTFQASLPGSSVVLRFHRIQRKTRARATSITAFAVLVTLRFGPLLLRREYRVDDSGSFTD
jgi:hypothetical protein